MAEVFQLWDRVRLYPYSHCCAGMYCKTDSKQNVLSWYTATKHAPNQYPGTTGQDTVASSRVWVDDTKSISSSQRRGVDHEGWDIPVPSSNGSPGPPNREADAAGPSRYLFAVASITV